MTTRLKLMPGWQRSEFGPVDQDDVLVAIAMAARAAANWYSDELDRGTALTDLLRAMAWVARATRGEPRARRPNEFLALLQTPLANWLPVETEESLARDDRPTEYCLDVLAESGSDPEAELFQSRVGESRATFARRPNGDS